MIFITKIHAYNWTTNEFCDWSGPNIEAISWTLAEEYLQSNGLGYCQIEGVLVAQVPEKELIPEWDKMINYDYNNN